MAKSEKPFCYFDSSPEVIRLVGLGGQNGRQETTHDPLRWFESSPEVIRLVVVMYVR